MRSLTWAVTTSKFQSSSSGSVWNRLVCCLSGDAVANRNQTEPIQPRAGCNIRLSRFIAAMSGVFQSSSSPKAGCNSDRRNPIVIRVLVSILIQPEGRMQRRPRRTRRRRRTRFNPHPARGPDATRHHHLRRGDSHGFQSSSSPRAGCNCSVIFVVSVMLSFQSSSSPRAGCNPKRLAPLV